MFPCCSTYHPNEFLALWRKNHRVVKFNCLQPERLACPLPCLCNLSVKPLFVNVCPLVTFAFVYNYIHMPIYLFFNMQFSVKCFNHRFLMVWTCVFFPIIAQKMRKQILKFLALLEVSHRPPIVVLWFFITTVTRLGQGRQGLLQVRFPGSLRQWMDENRQKYGGW